MENKASQETAEKPQGETKLNFWDKPSTKAAEARLDVWASVAKARIQKTRSTPKLSAIFEQPESPVESYIDETSGLKVIDASWFRPTSSGKTETPEAYTYLAVEQILKISSLYDLVPLLLRLYPRSGPYQVAHRIVGDGGAHSERLGESACKAAISAIARRWGL